VSFNEHPDQEKRKPYIAGFVAIIDGNKSMPFSHLMRFTKVVICLIACNVLVYLLQFALKGKLEMLLAITESHPFQFWRLLTFQFLHDSHTMVQLIVNMLGLYFWGPTLERYWGSKKFLCFYLICGAASGAAFIFASHLIPFSGGSFMGASGAVLGLLVACAIIFPQFQVVIFIFRVPIRLGAVILVTLLFLFVFSHSDNPSGHLCYLGGAACSLIWLRWQIFFAKLRSILTLH